MTAIFGPSALYNDCRIARLRQPNRRCGAGVEIHQKREARDAESPWANIDPGGRDLMRD